VNGPEILQIIGHDLQRAVAGRGKPPTARPIGVSPWLAMSIMQKAVRREREDLALGAPATLLRDAPDKLWRRIGCIAYEDIGVASLEAVGLATAALAGKQARAAFGGEWAVAASVILELCRVPKCRAADDLVEVCDDERIDYDRDWSRGRRNAGAGALVRARNGSTAFRPC
jgi:hypothetical protein